MSNGGGATMSSNSQSSDGRGGVNTGGFWRPSIASTIASWTACGPGVGRFSCGGMAAGVTRARVTAMRSEIGGATDAGAGVA